MVTDLDAGDSEGGRGFMGLGLGVFGKVRIVFTLGLTEVLRTQLKR